MVAAATFGALLVAESQDVNKVLALVAEILRPGWFFPGVEWSQVVIEHFNLTLVATESQDFCSLQKSFGHHTVFILVTPRYPLFYHFGS